MIRKIILTCGLLASQLNATEHRFIVDIMPGSFLHSSEIPESIEGSTSGGLGSLAPNISLGYGLDLSSPLSIDASVGKGGLLNGAFSTSYIQAELTVYGTSASKKFMMGPFFRIMNFTDSSSTKDNFEMSSTSGQAYGLAMMVGGNKVKFKMKVAKLTNTNISLKGGRGDTPSSISLDGTFIELGVGLRF